jgi:hypothetical protein
MVAVPVSLPMDRVARVAGWFALLVMLSGFSYAQEEPPPKFPTAPVFQAVSPEPSEFLPPPGGLLRSTQFGAEIVRDADTVLIQESAYPDSQSIGRVAVFTRNRDSTWSRTGTIDPADGQAFDFFGQQMALLDDLALIGSAQGVYVYRREHGTWKLTQKVRLPSGLVFADVALLRGWAFISSGAEGEGLVQVYDIKHRDSLHLVQTLRSSSSPVGDFFGDHLAVSDGTLLVSAVGDSDDRGAAYVFQRHGNRWVKRQKLVSINGAAVDLFATSIAISGDWIAIGAPHVQGLPDDNCEGGANSGALYVFRRIAGVWLQRQVLPAEDVRQFPFSCVHEFGDGVAISDEWIVGTTSVSPVESAQPVIYRRSAGRYTPIAVTEGSGGAVAILQLTGRTLFVGAPIDVGCEFEACLGSALIYHLDEASP